jgi:hypothetical protein
MVRRAEHEPTMEEIVVALRETRRGADRAAPFNVANRRTGGNRNTNVVTYPQNWIAGATDVQDLRDSETERLLAENTRLNERIVFLLKIIEREQARSAQRAAIEADRDAVFREVRATLKAELRPPLLLVLRLLEKQLADPTRPQSGDLPSAWIVDLIRKLDGDAPHDSGQDQLILPNPRPTLRQRLGRVFHALGF